MQLAHGIDVTTIANRRNAFAAVLVAALIACAAPEERRESSATSSSSDSSPAPAAAPPRANAPEPAATSSKPIAWSQKISGTTLAIDLVALPAGSIETDDPNARGAKRALDLSAFSISKLEIPWEAYDAFVFGLDKPSPDGSGASSASDATDAVTRPSHPYITMDRGYGHAGYPAISVSFHGAEEFCRWLTIKSGRKFRLPTESEWEYACRAGDRASVPFDGDLRALDAHAWYRANAQAKTHPCGAKEPNAWGLGDMLGNAGEWCTSADGKGVVRGGSFRDEAEAVTFRARKPADPAWNKSDPQLPRGIWWLADGGFVGFRIVCEAAGDSVRESAK
jgi:formylglycine-generating enzyme required for sulfatase activity